MFGRSILLEMSVPWTARARNSDPGRSTLSNVWSTTNQRGPDTEAATERYWNRFEQGCEPCWHGSDQL